MTYALYTDKTGRGDGDFVNDFASLAEARAAADALYCYHTGYNIYVGQDEFGGGGQHVEGKAPTQPDEPEVYTAMDMFEAGYF